MTGSAIGETARSRRGGSSTLHPRLLLDISSGDLARAALACVLVWRRGRLMERILAGRSGVIVCFSVRSAFDLVLEALALPEGTEIAFSAVTHPDMPRIASAHGLRAVPVDLDLDTLAPRQDALERALSGRARVMVVAHLFGGRVDLGPIGRIARERGVLLVEDCAQSLHELPSRPDSGADVSMLSFGTIKTATALGGALLWVSDPALAKRVRAAELKWRTQSRLRYLRKVLRMLALVVIGRPRLYALLARATSDLDALVTGSVRAFPGDELLAEIRRRPSVPLLWLLARRLETFDGTRTRRRAEVGEHCRDGLPVALFHPGSDAVAPTHWVFPVLSGDPDALVRRLRREGFDAARATSGIGAVPGPPDRPELRPTAAERLMSSVVFLPVYPELPRDELARMLEVLR